jgi:hypothetical protein
VNYSNLKKAERKWQEKSGVSDFIIIHFNFIDNMENFG